MARKKNNNLKLKNQIKEITLEEEVSSVLVGLWVDVNKSTVSGWNSNSSQPTVDNLDKIGELFEIDNRMLFTPDNRIKTGFAKALQIELDRLIKDKKLPIYVEIKDEKSGRILTVNNPELVDALRVYGNNYKKINK